MAEPGGSDRRRLVAIGGGGFTISERNPALDRLVLELSQKPVPKICFLPSASGDPRVQMSRFYERFSGWSCVPSVLSLSDPAPGPVLDPVAHLLAQDAIYAGGGAMRNMIEVWREHGVDRALRSAWESGAVLVGISAAAMCWFEGGVTRSSGAPDTALGLGLVPGSLSVHMNSEPDRLPVYREAVASGTLPAGHAVDDCTALVFHGTKLARCVKSRAPARVVSVRPDGAGGTAEEPLEVELLPGA